MLTHMTDLWSLMLLVESVIEVCPGSGGGDSSLLVEASSCNTVERACVATCGKYCCKSSYINVQPKSQSVKNM